MIKKGDLVECTSELALWGVETLTDVDSNSYREFDVGSTFLVVDIIEEESIRNDEVLFVYYVLMTSDGMKWLCEYTTDKMRRYTTLESIVKNELRVI